MWLKVAEKAITSTVKCVAAHTYVYTYAYVCVNHTYIHFNHILDVSI